MKKRLAIIFVLSLVSFAQITLAEPPTISVFSATQQFVNSNAPLGFYWTASYSDSATISITCPTGVKLQTTSGSAFSCASSQSVGSASGNGSLDIIASNVSGSVQTIAATITPSYAGTSFPSAAKTVYVSVYPDQEPINTFSISPTSATNFVESYAPVTFTWGSRGTTGINLKISCASSIIASSTSYVDSQIFPCDRPIFTNDLASSGSLAVTFLNTGNSDTIVKLTFLPAMEKGVYNGVYPKVVELTVKPYRAPVASISQFTAEPVRILSTGSTTLSWRAVNTGGVNVRTVCPSDLTFITYASTTKRETNCGDLLFAEPLSASGSVSVKVVNGIDSVRKVAFLLIPLVSQNNYDAQLGKSVDVTVESWSVNILPIGSVGTPAQGPITPAVIPGVGSVNSVINKNQNAYNFLKYLTFGSRGVDVTALQNYLKSFKDLYPEGLVTGYFGPATLRAVQRFQVKYGLAKKGDAGYGVVGPKTRAKLNEVQ
ncbi:MAG: hypothetical protein A3B08_03495 [Candidatus Taylorbacteria bacterium RIFCSPLOWO2_01_FULL_43_44]|uniref:Peptidoglycan binding-like domain-containing protein n=1 Tax=Candidatus Taylorbacteria bacterium RIFCSPHIGHO2_02_FULL_43_32b TaxID=1802306 RepID=A0A1G2MHM8_9BACT|nr:MAG: hypothetical protein A2743_01750 [Candidatus Taylorbacteria bacterium RIFCSPHIGHO2_01_FULL_43_47]OHA23357.1 MAG: hypothetical protein A3C72_00290 [Candidatus Taylorbacteria bacterium RIFCSPHIGHO2_02_FULL_43_32b]OHA30336.1 MAG: hypothetical protein A3B08_03495 [Candidatus Taylorbacteria bacterium RIFCSPLOWO2_01_FULL_43_44]